MARYALQSLALLSFYVILVLFIHPPRALGFNRGSFSPSVGIWASTVTVHGFQCQELEVRTDDGYILSRQRVPEGRLRSPGQKTQPILLQHGVLADGMIWLLNSPNESLPLILADSGFDVWIANTRRTRFSRRHTTLDPSNPAFWDWSWNELVIHDLAAYFDFVVKQTGQRVDYVGRSLGTLLALASFSEGKQVRKVRSAALLSPITYLSHISSKLGVAAAKTFVGEQRSSQLPQENVCRARVDCYDLITAITGNNCCVNASMLNLLLNNYPQPTSTKNLLHLAQTVRDGVLAKYDYGIDILEHYGTAKPPVYNLSNIPRNLPLFLSYGGRDALSDVADMEILLDSLKLHDREKLRVQYVKDYYAHADFILGVTAKDVVYKQIVAFFKPQQ